MAVTEKQPQGKSPVGSQMPESIIGEVIQTEKPFTVWSGMAIGATTTNTAVGVLLTLGSITAGGGSVTLFWGFLLMAVVGLACATSLSELASAIPDAGGQYIWVANLSPPRSRRFLSYATAIFSWAGAVCTGASVCVVGPALLFSLGSLLNPDFQLGRWEGFAAYHATNILTLGLSAFEHLLPRFTKGILTFTIFMLIAFFVGIFAASQERLSAKDVFTNFTNVTGWSNGVSFFISLNGLNWGFSCLDAIVHIAEEIPQPSVNVPKALMLTIVVGVVTGLPIVLAFAFNMTNLETQTSAMTTMYVAFRQSNAAAIGYQVALFISAVGAMWGIHVWQSRLAWTIALNKGFPLAEYLGKVHGAPFHTPLWALIWSASFTSLLSFVYVASETAFNSLVSAGILFQYASYAMPIVLLLKNGRSQFEHGPFWYPRLGLLANIVFLSWAPISLVFYCFPYYFPVVVGDMNYISVVLAVVIVLILTFWFAYACKNFAHPELGSNRAL
ncbi:Swainsonine transporter swnT [Fusarium oxysporum f. sp. cubense]|uniref:Swainsonine transporter swnT n=1 Tax=Fusarium oxysporum f. sp. cubense TaxID=61366 RepID=A0A559L7K8_FUSOC|nr:Swainsonine transporter swnT [Fusarium oxysporum f. sp. cubense]